MDPKLSWYRDACGALRRQTMDEKLEEIKKLCEEAYWDGYRLGHLHGKTGYPIPDHASDVEKFGEDHED